MTIYSDKCYDSNEMIVLANTEGLGNFQPLDRFIETPNQYLFHAGAYWREQKKLEREGHEAPYLGAAEYMKSIGFTQDQLNSKEFHVALSMTNPSTTDE